MIDWQAAVNTGIRWARPGPQVSLSEARRTVAELRELAQQVAEPVQEVTGMISAEEVGRVAVVDRPGWIRANVDGFRVILEPLVEQLRARQNGDSSSGRSSSFGGSGGSGGGVFASVGSRFTGIQAGLILAYLSGRVLGQYELFLPPSEDGTSLGRLTLVAPNIVMVERELGVDPHDFRKWVCLHEETHRLQFTAVPWLRDYFVGLVSELLGPLSGDPAGFVEVVKRAATEVRNGRNPAREAGVVGMLATPEQQQALSRISGMMSLLEGHGDVTMNRAGAGEVPGAAHFARVLHERRTEARGLTRLISKLLGLDAKMRQYAEGERFVEAVEGSGGPALLARVWEGPEWLPTLEEIRDPARWVARADGAGGAVAAGGNGRAGG
jgi:coenzyme F420 biosynthesis associated uncharacterized protein